MPTYDPIEFGAKADGKTLDTKAIQAAIDRATNAGGGTVILHPGKLYLSGSLVLKTNVTLHVDAGSVLQCSPVSACPRSFVGTNKSLMVVEF